jgi:hypothetical protein
MRVTLLLLLIVACAVGCDHRLNGSFEFTNHSNTMLSVDVSGFEDNPPVGDLYPTGTKGSSMRSMPLPSKVTITWSEGHEIVAGPNGVASHFSPDTQLFTKVISLASITNWQADATLHFDFESNHVWNAYYDKEP